MHLLVFKNPNTLLVIFSFIDQKFSLSIFCVPWALRIVSET